MSRTLDETVATEGWAYPASRYLCPHQDCNQPPSSWQYKPEGTRTTLQFQCDQHDRAHTYYACCRCLKKNVWVNYKACINHNGYHHRGIVRNTTNSQRQTSTSNASTSDSMERTILHANPHTPPTTPHGDETIDMEIDDDEEANSVSLGAQSPCPLVDATPLDSQHDVDLISGDCGEDSSTTPPNDTSEERDPSHIYSFNEKDNTFFSYEANGNGLMYLFARAQTGSSRIDESSTPWNHEEEVELGLHLAWLAMHLPKQHLKRVGRVLHLARKQFERNLNPAAKGPRPRVPESYSEFRSDFIKNKHAYLQNMPHPPILKQGTVAYTPIIACLQDLLAHGIPTAEICPSPDGKVRKLMESKSALAILERARSKIPGIIPKNVFGLIFWGDDYESNYNKTERNSSNAKQTITIAAVKGPHVEARFYTYPVALGPKGAWDDLDEVETIHNKELEELASGKLKLYLPPDPESGLPGRHEHVYAEVMVALQDQPQRRKFNKLAQGNSTYHACFGFRYDHLKQFDKLRSCPSCLEILEKTEQQNDGCVECHSWTLPSSCKLSYDQLAIAVKSCHDRIVEGILTKTAAVAELKENCIDTAFTEAIVENAQNARTLKQLHDNGALGEHPEITELLEMEPWRFEPSRHPPAWHKKFFSISQNVDVPMHIIFLGLVKSSMVLINVFLSLKTKWPSYVRRVKGVPESVQKLNVSWCKARPYGKTGKFGGKVSENYLADARFLPWLYSPLSNLANAEPYEEPTDRPVSRWIMPETKGWLQARGIPVGSKERAPQLREKVQYYKNLPNPPEILKPKGGEMDDCRKMIWALTALVARLMTSVVDDEVIQDTKRHVRIFLDYFEMFEAPVRKVKPKKHKRGVDAIDLPGASDSANVDDENEPDPGNILYEEEDYEDEVEKNGQGLTMLVTEPDEADAADAVSTAVVAGEEICMDTQGSSSQKTKGMPKIVSSYNFCCLPNLVAVMALIGPLREIWEGGFLGEGSLPMSKGSRRTQGHKKNWQINQLRYEHLLLAMWKLARKANVTMLDDIFTKSQDMDDNEDDNENEESTKLDDSDNMEPNLEDNRDGPHAGVGATMVRTYKEDELCDVIEFKHEPVSVVRYQGEGNVYWARISGQQERCVEVVDYHGRCFGYHYFDMQLGTSIRGVDDSRPIQAYCILLPRLSGTVLDSSIDDDNDCDEPFRADESEFVHLPYSVITSEWETIQSNGTLSRFRIPGLHYEAGLNEIL